MSPRSNRQKYNFLAALVKQVDEAQDDDDDLYHQWRTVVCGTMLDTTKEMYEQLDAVQRTYDDLLQRIQECESALAELDDAGGEDPGEVPFESDDGDDYDDVGVVQPEVGGVQEGHRRVAPSLAGASNGQGSGRVREHRRANRVRAQPELRKVRRGT